MGVNKSSRIVLRCENLFKSFSQSEENENKLEVINGIDLEIKEGALIAIVGASGSGKSTLLHILGGLDHPDSGIVLWDDTNIFTLSRERLAKLRGKTVGFVFQFHHLLNEFTALENVMLPILIQGENSGNAEQRAIELLKRFELLERQNNKPNKLSGGEQQRVAIARALANRPNILLADEPTGNLDDVNSEQLYKILLELNKKDNLTTILVTHNRDLAKQCQQMYRLASGKLNLL